MRQQLTKHIPEVQSNEIPLSFYKSKIVDLRGLMGVEHTE